MATISKDGPSSRILPRLCWDKPMAHTSAIAFGDIQTLRQSLRIDTSETSNASITFTLSPNWLPYRHEEDGTCAGTKRCQRSICQHIAFSHHSLHCTAGTTTGYPPK